MSVINSKTSILLYGFHLKVQLFCIVLLSFLTGLSVAKPSIAFKKYTVKDGLSHNYVRGILQDSEGFIWIATEDGLNKFNSYTFQVYKYIPGDSSSITNHPIMALEEDRDHNVWIGTWGGGIYIYNRKLDNFSRIQNIGEKSKNNSLGSNYIFDLFRDSKGRMWAGTSGGGIMLINQDTNVHTHFIHSPKNQKSLSHNRVMSITEDQDGKLWLGTFGGGVNQFDPETGIFNRYIHQDNDRQSLSHNDAYVVFCDSKQRLWVGTWDSGLNLMEKNTGKFTHFRYEPDNPHSISSNEIWSITETSDGRIWIGTDNGLSLYNDEAKNFYVYSNNPFDPKSLGANSVKSLYTDKQGRLWVGTVNAGVSMFDKRFIQIHHYYTKLNEKSLSYNDVSAFLSTSEEKVIIGTDGGGINLLDKSTNQFIHYKHDPKNPESIGSNKVKALLLDHKNRIWIGFWGGGLDYFDQNRQTFMHFRKNSGHPKLRLNSDNVTCLAEDQDGIIWIGTFGGGLHKFDPENKTFTYYTQQPNDPGSLSDRQIWAVLVDHQNNVWVGTSNGQLDLFDREHERFIHVLPQELRESGHAAQVLFEDSKKRMWIGLEGGGLKLLNKEKMTFKTYTMEQGLPSNNINAIEEAYDGYLWLSTNHGIARFDPETGLCENFDLSDGLQGLHFNRQASGKLKSGHMLFGGINGFNMFHPDSLTGMIPDAPIVFTGFQIFNKPVPIGEEGYPLQTHINKTDAITLSYKQSVFSLEYAELNYTAPEKVRYKYRLLGFVDETWQEAGIERKVTYTNLQPGNYVFEVTTVSNDGVPFPARTLSIFVAPPWWQTWWARILAVLTLGAGLLAVYQLRLRSVKSQNKKLEREVAERTMKLQQANHVLREMNLLIQEQKEEILSQAKELAESNEEITSINQQLEERVELRTADLKKSNEELDNFVYRVSHDIRAPLSSVLGLVELIENEKDPTQIGLYLKMATSSINKLDGFVKDILNYSRNSRMKIECKEIDFSEILDSVLEEMQYMNKAERLQIIRDFYIKSPHYNDPRRLHIIFRNLFSNAIKYQNMREGNPFVRIQIIAEEEAVIIVEDNGMGIAANQVDKVFDMFYRGSDVSTGSGIGLYIVKETVDKLNGCISLQSELGVGTTFTIKLPNIQPEE